MVAYKGKTAPSSLKQYMPNKPAKHGFKLWSKSGVSGYIYEVNLYSGSTKDVLTTTTNNPSVNSLKRTTRLNRTTVDNNEEEERLQRRVDRKALGVGGMVVIDLIKNVPKGTKVFVNNYFGSIALIKRMSELGYGIICTLRANRIGGCPVLSEKAMKKKDRGFYDYRITNDRKCVVLGWKDSKRVLIGSNYVAVNPVGQPVRYDKVSKKRIDVPAPQIIKEYNKNMSGVDTTDMLCALHSIPFRSKKWYMRLAWRIFDLMISNAWLVSKHLSGRIANWRIERLFYFKLNIARSLLQIIMITIVSNRIIPKSISYEFIGRLLVFCSNETHILVIYFLFK